MGDEEREPSLEELAAQLRDLPVDQFVAAAASTIASLGFAKLDAGDLAQARKAIDVLAALLPHLEGDVRRDLQAALSNLQVAYAGSD
ncbi:MAG TPA: hypothetical protein VFA05_00970 [Gaiellaceae bacterium]|nr:hypothetical protein [Gaiellaceae bacterium]